MSFPRVRMPMAKKPGAPCPCGHDHAKEGMALPSPTNPEAVKKYLEIHGTGGVMPVEASVRHALASGQQFAQRRDVAFLQGRSASGWRRASDV